MNVWLWILFWSLFWVGALTYLGWRTWRLWPHARDFGRTLSSAFSRLDTARSLAEQATAPNGGEGARQGEKASLTLVPDQSRSKESTDDLAWEIPAAEWRERRCAAARRRRDLRLDEHAEVWATWRDPLE